MFEIDWQETFFWLALIEAEAIKDKYDPHRLFVVAEGVGSEDWNKNRHAAIDSCVVLKILSHITGWGHDDPSELLMRCVSSNCQFALTVIVLC